MTNQLGFTARLLYVVALVLPTVLIADTMTTRAASAEVSSPDTYGSTQRNFKNSAAGVTSLTVRGWIDDVCLQFDLECLTQKSDNKGETTAQSKVIRELSWELNHRFSPNLNANGGVQADPVQWEVVLPTATSTKRVDVVVEDRSIEESFGIMEVKIWSNRVQVQPQIEEYIGVATNNGITAKADARLNLPDPRHGRDMAWAKPYVYSGSPGTTPNQTDIWCVWADPEPLNDGSIYFWPADDENVPHANYQKHCLDPDKEEVRKRTEAEAAADQAVKMRESQPRVDIMIFDAVGTTDAYGRTTYEVVVVESPTKARFDICYGDGTCETRSIPAGSGTQILSFDHTFSAPSTGRFGPHVYFVQGTLSPENGAPKSSQALTTRDAESLAEAGPSWVEEEGWDAIQALIVVATLVAFVLISVPFIALGLILFIIGGGGGHRANGCDGGVSDADGSETGGIHVLGVCIC